MNWVLWGIEGLVSTLGSSACYLKACFWNGSRCVTGRIAAGWERVTGLLSWPRRAEVTSVGTLLPGRTLISAINFTCRGFLMIITRVCVLLNARSRSTAERCLNLTATYDHLTGSVVKLMHPLISSAKAITDLRIFIHPVYIWSMKQHANGN